MNLLPRAALTMILLLIASTALAGGKSSTRIKVKNRSTGPIAVAIDAGAATTITEFIAAGGKYINAGNSKSFRVTAGDHTVYVVDAVNPVFPATSLLVDVQKHHTETVVYANGVLTEK